MRKHSDLFRFHFRSVTTLQTAVEESEGLRRSARLGGVCVCVSPDLLTDQVDGLLFGKTHILIDRDIKVFDLPRFPRPE